MSISFEPVSTPSSFAFSPASFERGSSDPGPCFVQETAINHLNFQVNAKLITQSSAGFPGFTGQSPSPVSSPAFLEKCISLLPKAAGVKERIHVGFTMGL